MVQTAGIYFEKLISEFKNMKDTHENVKIKNHSFVPGQVHVLLNK